MDGTKTYQNTRKKFACLLPAALEFCSLHPRVQRIWRVEIVEIPPCVNFAKNSCAYCCPKNHDCSTNGKSAVLFTGRALDCSLTLSVAVCLAWRKYALLSFFLAAVFETSCHDALETASKFDSCTHVAQYTELVWYDLHAITSSHCRPYVFASCLHRCAGSRWNRRAPSPSPRPVPWLQAQCPMGLRRERAHTEPLQALNGPWVG